MAGKATLVTSHATRLIHLSIRLPGNHGVPQLLTTCLSHSRICHHFCFSGDVLEYLITIHTTSPAEQMVFAILEIFGRPLTIDSCPERLPRKHEAGSCGDAPNSNQRSPTRS